VSGEDVVLFGGFEGASLAAIRKTGNGRFEVDCLQEADVPAEAFNRVFYDYSFAVGVRNPTGRSREVRIRLRLCERSAARNIGFMCGPYWIKQGRAWRHLLPSNHEHGRDWVDTTLRLSPGEQTVLSTRPIWTASETEEILGEYAARVPFASVRSLGRTAEGRHLWVIETGPREERVFIHASFQSAEFAGGTVLHVLDWLGTPTHRSAELLERYQFSIFPVPMPDGVAHGHSIMNARGSCPMLEFGRAVRGQPCAEESLQTWRDLAARPPVLALDVHVHPGEINSPKLNPVKASSYRDGACAERAARVERAVLACCPDWRYVPVPLDDPEFDMQDSLPVLAAKHLGTASFCLQDYALTAEGAGPLLIAVLDAALRAL